MATSSTGMNSIGVGSGLPLAELLAKMRTVEEQPLIQIKQRQTSFETKLSSYGVLKSAVTGLETAGKALADSATYGGVKATSSDANIVAASASANTPAGDYRIEVSQLATRNSVAAQGIASRDTLNGTGGTLTIRLAGDTEDRTLELKNGDTSLKALVTAINEAEGLGVTATIINNGDSSSPHRLVLTAKDTGTQASIANVSVSGNSSLDAIVNYGNSAAGGMTQASVAQDAKLTANGIEITSGSNTVKDAIDGVTLNLLTTTATDKPITLTVAADHTATRNAVQNFVNAYNTFNSVVKGLTSYNAENDTASALTGDTVARTVQTGLRDMLFAEVSGGTFKNLSQLGIVSSANVDGSLSIDTEVFNKILDENPGAIKDFFTGDKGFSAEIAKRTDSYLKSGGLFANADAGMQRSIRDVKAEYTRTQERIEDTMARYTKQFRALDSLVASMSGTSAYLTQQINVLNGTQNQK